ncbi:MAG: hypothetical protein BHW64_02850 [Candidatus Melainabacteria bacterium LEY3_CP_29_8]|nr:MAG: hypothetical protein BHW64_02850 [Candidatus Melainabacteria bacterium LEY3_CP_29_8]
MVEQLQTISVPTQRSVAKVSPTKIEQNATNNLEVTKNSTTIIQDLQEKINAKATLIFSWQNLANIITNQLLSGKLSESDARSSKYMVNDLETQIKNAKNEIEQLKAQLEAEQNSASQDNTTKNESQKAQVLAQNALSLKSTIEQQK